MESIKNIKQNSYDYLLHIIRTTSYVALPLMAMITWILGVSVIVFGSIRSNVDQASDFIETFVLFSLPMLIFFVVLPILIKMKTDGKSLDDLGLCFHPNKRNITILVANIAFLSAVCVMFCIQASEGANQLIAIIVHILAIGISEEIMIRCIIYDELRRKYSIAVSVIVSSLVFAIVYHSGDGLIPNMLIRFPLGLVLAIIRVWTKNIYSSIVMHSWYNMLMLII